MRHRVRRRGGEAAGPTPSGRGTGFDAVGATPRARRHRIRLGSRRRRGTGKKTRRYSSRGQAGLDQHGDACRYSATVALTPPRHRGVSVPAYASLPPQTCERRRSGDATETCVDPRAYPERLFAREPFKWEFPLLEYERRRPWIMDAAIPRRRRGHDVDVPRKTSTEHLRHGRGAATRLHGRSSAEAGRGGAAAMA